MRKIFVVGCLSIMVALTMFGCATVKTAPISGVGQCLEAERGDYVVTGTVEGTGKSVTICGLTFPWGAPLGVVSSGQALMIRKVAVAQGIAVYDALGKVPDADTILPMTTTIEKNGIPFLYRTFTATVKAKAIKIKTDAELVKK